MSFRILFLFIFAAAHFKFSVVELAILCVGFFGFAKLDEWLRKRARWKAIDDALDPWEVDEEDPKFEKKGNWRRRRLTDENQIIVTRVVMNLGTLPEA